MNKFSRKYTNSQMSELKTLVEGVFGEGRLMSRNGGQLAVRCFNSKCSSKNSPEKRKLEFNLPTGIYSCWTCGMKGILRENNKIIISLSKANSKAKHLRNWLSDNSIVDQNKIPKDLIEGEKWSSGIIQFLFNEFQEDEEEKEIELENLSQYRLALARSNSPAWEEWRKRWDGYLGDRLDSQRAAWGLDVRYVPHRNGYEYQIPGWSSDGRLLGIHLWRPTDYIRYQHVGEKSNFILGENLINWKEPVYLVEGLWDLIIGGENTICLLGSTLPYGSRIEYLLALFTPKVYLCLDRDAQEKAWIIAKNLNNMGIDCSILTPPNKDPGECKLPIIEWSKKVSPKVWSWENSILEKLETI